MRSSVVDQAAPPCFSSPDALRVLVPSSKLFVYQWNSAKLFAMVVHTQQYHLEFGRHSNIPDCCIVFWIKYIICNPFSYDLDYIHRDEWGGNHLIYEEVDLLSAYLNALSLMQGPRWRYVPCPLCLANQNRVNIHICDEDDPDCRRFIAREECE